MLAQGISVGSWNTKPSAPGAGLPPLHSMVPLVGDARPAISRSAVDLPQPDGPSSETNSPGRTSRSSPSSAMTPLAKVLATSRSATTGGSAGTRDDNGESDSAVPRDQGLRMEGALYRVLRGSKAGPGFAIPLASIVAGAPHDL